MTDTNEHLTDDKRLAMIRDKLVAWWPEGADSDVDFLLQRLGQLERENAALRNEVERFKNAAAIFEIMLQERAVDADNSGAQAGESETDTVCEG